MVSWSLNIRELIVLLLIHGNNKKRCWSQKVDDGDNPAGAVVTARIGDIFGSIDAPDPLLRRRTLMVDAQAPLRVLTGANCNIPGNCVL